MKARRAQHDDIRGDGANDPNVLAAEDARGEGAKSLARSISSGKSPAQRQPRHEAIRGAKPSGHRSARHSLAYSGRLKRSLIFGCDLLGDTVEGERSLTAILFLYA